MKTIIRVNWNKRYEGDFPKREVESLDSKVTIEIIDVDDIYQTINISIADRTPEECLSVAFTLGQLVQSLTLLNKQSIKLE